MTDQQRLNEIFNKIAAIDRALDSIEGRRPAYTGPIKLRRKADVFECADAAARLCGDDPRRANITFVMWQTANGGAETMDSPWQP